ncbi:MAG: DivIVA domain-containing protein [Proteobacteria bacterium]|nr:DivIVA domain-containing protein [Pseudomonadota bacterium]
MISVSAAENHRFGRVRKNGYDPAEVDAVVARLIESLHSYEERTEKLEERLAEADASADAIRRTFITAERTRDEILSEATAEAEEMVARARSEAADLRSEAESLKIEIASERENALAEASAEAGRLMLEAEKSAAQRSVEAQEELRAARRDAITAAAERTHEAAAARHAAAMATAWMTTAAHEDAQAIVDEAKIEAAAISRDSQREGEVLRVKVASMRAAVAALQHAATDLATLTTEEGKVIDLKAIEALGDDIAGSPQAVPDPPQAVPDTPEEEPLLTVAEARREMERSDDDDEAAPPPAEPRTYYQRTTGTPLSERIKIARTPG